MKLLTLILTAFLVPLTIWAPPHKTEYMRAYNPRPWATEMGLMVKVLCKYESRSEADPSDAMGEKYLDIGRCQNWVPTARRVSKWKGTNRGLMNDIFDRPEHYATLTLKECHRYGWKSPRNAAMCYYRGPRFDRDDPKTKSYGKINAAAYAYWWRKLQGI